MADFILHHYPESPFSEKIRLILGYKGVDYHSVIIPMIMPKPDLMPLTGGYRKTPVAQVGADIYCDSAMIASVLDHLYPDKPIYSAKTEASAGILANWTDTFFFRIAVQIAFQPKALANNTTMADPEKAAAFVADRAELSKGSSALQMAFETASPYFFQHLKRIDNQLATSDGFLFGDAPNIADFSTYHCFWFINNNEALRDLFEPFSNVRGFMDRMAAFGQGKSSDMTGAEALEIARSSTPETEVKIAALGADGLSEGDTVEIMPIDYGFQPVTGKILIASLEELALTREDEQVGQVAVHFPRLGFQARKIS